MMLYRTYIATSDTPEAGQGLFAAETIPQGALLGVCAVDYDMFDETAYDELQERQDRHVIKGAYRLVGGLFMRSHDMTRADNYMNHADDPNVLYHCGMMFALRPIKIDEELTCDYRLFLSENDSTSFPEAGNGEHVRGYDATTALVEGAKKILELYENNVLLTRKKTLKNTAHAEEAILQFQKKS